MTLREKRDCFRFALRLSRDFSRETEILAVLHALFGAAAPLIPTIFSALLVQELTGNRNQQKLMLYALLLTVLTALFGFCLRLIQQKFDDRRWLLRDYEAKLFEDHISGTDYELLEDASFQEAVRSYGVIYQNNGGIYGNMWRFAENFLQGLLSFICALALISRQLYVCFFQLDGRTFITSPLSTVVLLGEVLLLAGLMLLTGNRCSRTHNEIWKTYAGIYGIFRYWCAFPEQYRNGKEIRLYAAQNLIAGIHQRWMRECIRIDRRLTRQLCQYDIPLFFLQAVLMGVLYLYIALKAHAGVFGAGSFVLFFGAAAQLAEGISGISSITFLLGTSAEQIRCFQQIVQAPQRIAKGSLPVEKRNDNRFSIAFDHVSFRYPGCDAEVLRDLSVQLEIGQHIAVVGQNGSGKTTFIKLLCRLYDVTGGRITLNGIDIKKYNPEEYRSLFSVVFQDFQLFSVPLSQNVAANLEIDREKLQDSLEKAGMADRVRELPDRENSVLYKDFDENGVEISGGEAQKIALARALYKDAPFVILDEPTAALDPEAEFEIYQRFNDFVDGKTAVYISHRLSSCRFCDNILVFDRGRIVQQGTHEQLLSVPGKYRELWQAQAGYYGG